MGLPHLATMKDHPTRQKEKANKKIMLTATIEISKKGVKATLLMTM